MAVRTFQDLAKEDDVVEHTHDDDDAIVVAVGSSVCGGALRGRVRGSKLDQRHQSHAVRRDNHPEGGLDGAPFHGNVSFTVVDVRERQLRQHDGQER